MSFLPDAEVPCAVCGGRRFRSDILSVRFSGRTAHDVLNLRVDEALAAFSEFDSISRRLRPFQQVGLGYMTLGQPASTFSGGEAQRIRLATELIEPVDSRSLYILDEPTRGLHGADVDRLLNVLRGLIDRGHSMIVIEHNTQVICAADWIIDLGPGPAESGGHIVAEGSVNSLRDHPTSVTGRWI
jgi:excinuclease ABC subunit A